eukprot:Sro166_g074130.1 n/a (544) ;mRNA; r:34033-35664
MNFLVPALAVWSVIVLLFWWPELKDDALDYYYLQYPEQQPLSPIPGTVLPLIPNVWIYDPDKQQPNQQGQQQPDERKQHVLNHLREHRQPHYYMLPQDYYEQMPPGEQDDNNNNQSTKIRGVLIFLHNCHQSGLHFFQLPESRIVAAQALKRGLAIFSPTASSASKLFTTNVGKGGKSKRDNPQQQPLQGGSDEKNCWSSLDGDELLGPLLYEWAKQMNVVSLPRMAIGMSNGANLFMASSLYKTLRLQSMALYGSHHPSGFNRADLDNDVIPATAFVVFPKNSIATEYAMRHYGILQQSHEADQEEMELRKEEEREELEKEAAEEEEDEEEDGLDSEKTKPRRRFFRKTQLWKIDPHAWTPSLCQARLPEYHTRCRSFFRHVQGYQKNKQRRQEFKQMKQDPQKRAKRLRLAHGGLQNAKQKFQLITSLGEVLQSSKSPQWVPVMQKLGLDDWTTHTMAFTLASYGNNKPQPDKKHQKMRKKTLQLQKFPTIATPEGRSWLWASMLQEIEAAYGVQEMTSEYSSQILDFLMYHAGLTLGAVS